MRRFNLIELFIHHPVAANLLMMILITTGLWALQKLNTQFFPNYSLDSVTVSVKWRGTSADDVEQSITLPLERQLRNLDNLKKMTSLATDGLGIVTLEFRGGTDMVTAVDRVKENVALVRELPPGSESPEIQRLVHFEPIAKISVIGPRNVTALRPLVRRMQRQLTDRGIAKIDISGLPEEEIAIQIPSARLYELGMTLDDIAARLAGFSTAIPAGSLGQNDLATQLRSMNQPRNEDGFAQLPLIADKRGRLVRLSDIATIQRRPRDNQVSVTYNGRPAVEMQLYRDQRADALHSAEIFKQWLVSSGPRLPADVQIHVYDQQWKMIKERIHLLISNGLSGLLLVMLLLFIFMQGRIAWWVSVGVPVSFLGTLVAVYASGGGINMISLFGVIMALGIIVDDAIVVAEESLTRFQAGASAEKAVSMGARRMLAPVLASSLTTVAAFFPTMLMGGQTGKIVFAIPLVVICVILISLIECFLILPNHLRHALPKVRGSNRVFAGHFEFFRDRILVRIVAAAVDYPWITISTTVSVLILVVGMVVGGRIGFVFFPSPESNILYAHVAFTAGTPYQRVRAFGEHLDEALHKINESLGGRVVLARIRYHGLANTPGSAANQSGRQYVSMMVELQSPDKREVRNRELIKRWRQAVKPVAGLEKFTISSLRSGPAGRDIDIRIDGGDAVTVKQAARELQKWLHDIKGVSAIEDDTPYGHKQLIYTLRPQGEALGLSVESVGRQLRAAYKGKLVQVFQQGDDEIEVVVRLPDDERFEPASLSAFNIILPDGRLSPLGNVVKFHARRGFQVLRHDQGRLTVHVMADVDQSINNSNKILASLSQKVLPVIAANYHVNWSLAGRASDQAEAFADMQIGGIMATVLIYIILAWVFESFVWPLLLFTAVPFGFIGAFLGHWIMGADLTVLSLWGLLGLMGVVVNDTIILISQFQELYKKSQAVKAAVVEAVRLRFRAIMLTSLTTIGGLAPLLMETSLQAQFLKPMAITIAFGLLFSSFIILFFVPGLIMIFHQASVGIKRRLDSMFYSTKPVQLPD